MKKEILKKNRRERGAAMTEYIIIVALVALGSIAVFSLFGNQIRAVISDSTKKMAGQDADHDSQYADGADGEVEKGLGDF